GWPDLNALFTQEIKDLQSVELQPRTEHKLELTDPITVPAAALHTEFGVTVTGGSYDERIVDSDLGAYIVEETATAMLTIEYEGVVLALTEIRQTLEGVLVNGTEQRPVQTGKPATVHFTVYND